MLDTLEFVLRILFFTLSIMWAGKIMILRTDKQIVITPSNEGIELLGMSIQNIKITLYCIYLVIVVIGIYATNRKNGIF